MGESDSPEHIPARDDEATCFLDDNRPCTAACMAFKTVGQDNDQLDPVQQHCVIISGVERAGRGLIGLASIGATFFRNKKKRDADEQRVASAGSPPSPGPPKS